jgi:hypothetical protein
MIKILYNKPFYNINLKSASSRGRCPKYGQPLERLLDVSRKHPKINFKGIPKEVSPIMKSESSCGRCQIRAASRLLELSRARKFF